jgi:hypothetical protein
MKILVCLIMLFILSSCSTDKGTFWCGDHPCINNKEKEAYFKKTMIVEIKDLEKNSSKSNSEIEKIILQTKKKEEKRIKEQEYMNKQSKLQAKKTIKEKKKLAKQEKLEAQRREKEEKNLTNQIEKDETRIVKKKKSEEPQQSVNFVSNAEEQSSFSVSFNKLVEKITKRNISRPYPDINDIQD